MATLSELLRYKASLDCGEGYVDDEDVAQALTLETALAEAENRVEELTSDLCINCPYDRPLGEGVEPTTAKAQANRAGGGGE